ncbi:DNA-processing protein DprA [Halomonas llamarensis]|uniref:DNA-processing protein DprA n=1 Tax=Halomonas llamarensis TaxID=2945104 RepID=A0ABT0SSV0_9GAMM|nr:DNA-processing protein DprA [Halomonas llamarensis]MCL7930910.1 DNA-processing protein DprA [Halomonas llamarensis]
MDAKEWLVLSALPGLGAQRIAKLAEQSPEWPHGWLALLPPQAASELRLWLDHPARSPLQNVVKDNLAWVAAAPHRVLLHRGHPAWPALLSEIADPPPVVWAQGDVQALALPGLAMVGTRRPTSEGAANAQAFARDFARRGWCVVSGMALGIDALAQRAALDAGGASIAVLASGIDVIYPARHRDLYDRLSQTPGGLVLAEHPLGTAARPAYFPRRNRIVTGLSLGTLVVEAAEKSGSLVSARLALEQGRELFAIPSSIHNLQAHGCLQLLRTGATLARSSRDILDELQHWAETFIPPPLDEPAAMSPAETPSNEPVPDTLLTVLSEVPTPIDTLVQQAAISVSECQQRLLMLELEGFVAQQTGGWVRLPRP